MAYVATAPAEYLADDLAKVIFVPKAKRKNILSLPMHKIGLSSLESVNKDRG